MPHITENEMQTQHTPGPWAAQIGARHIDVEADDWIITETDTHKSDSPPRAQCIANARLIAAAPELLEALKKVAQSLEWHAHGCCRGIDDGGPLPTNEAVELAKRTIAKAIGHDA